MGHFSRRTFGLLIGALVCVLLCAVDVAAQGGGAGTPIHVWNKPPAAGTDREEPIAPYTTFLHAAMTIGDALDEAEDSDVILIRHHVPYVEHLEITVRLTLIGEPAFNSKETDCDTFKPIVMANTLSTPIIKINTSKLVRIVGLVLRDAQAAPAILSGIEKNKAEIVCCDFFGNDNGPDPMKNGGAVALGKSDSVTVSGCRFQGNRASEFGGALNAVFVKSLTLRNNVFEANKTITKGGGGANVILCDQVILRDNSFKKNEAAAGISPSSAEILAGSLNGGGLRIEGSRARIKGGAFDENTTSLDGGGVSVLPSLLIFQRSAVEMTDVTLSKNTAVDDGGGISVTLLSTFSGRSLTLRDNVALKEGGGFHASCASAVTLEQSLFESNKAPDPSQAALTGRGGGLFARNSRVALRDSIFRSNTARRGGGLFLFTVNDPFPASILCNSVDGNLQMEGVEFSGNSADFEGGGVHIRQADRTIVFNIRNCFFRGNISQLPDGGGDGSSRRPKCRRPGSRIVVSRDARSS